MFSVNSDGQRCGNTSIVQIKKDPFYLNKFKCLFVFKFRSDLFKIHCEMMHLVQTGILSKKV